MRSSCARVTPCKQKKSDSKLLFKNSDTMARRLGRLQPGDGSVLEGAPRGGEKLLLLVLVDLHVVDWSSSDLVARWEIEERRKIWLV